MMAKTSKSPFSSLLAAAILLSLASVLAQAQSRYNGDTPKLEVGGQFTVTRVSDILDDTNLGGGGRLTYNFSRNVAVEGEFNYFPNDLGTISATSSYQGLFGLKTGIRSEKYGIFGKIRPGFTRFDRVSPLPTATEFTMDVGAVLEVYPIRSTVVRFDIGDTMINYGADLVTPASFTHNLQFGIGIGYRF